MKKKFIRKAGSMLVILGMSFNIQAGSVNELAKHRKMVDSAIDDLKSTIATCRSQIDKIDHSSNKSCTQALKIRLKCREKIDSHIETILMAHRKLGHIHDSKCGLEEIE